MGKALMKTKRHKLKMMTSFSESGSTAVVVTSEDVVTTGVRVGSTGTTPVRGIGITGSKHRRGSITTARKIVEMEDGMLEEGMLEEEVSLDNLLRKKGMKILVSAQLSFY